MSDVAVSSFARRLLRDEHPRNDSKEEKMDG